MSKEQVVKIALIGAGSISFTPASVKDILLSEKLRSVQVEIVLMDIDERSLEVSLPFAIAIRDKLNRETVKISATKDLDVALTNTNFVITAIEVERNYYWSMDFHLSKKYGFRSVYGENGGPGGMFHLLRNLPPMLHIVRRMEVLCPDALLINYTNPEAKLVDALSKLSKIRMAGVCHGFEMGVVQIAKILGREKETIDVKGHGLNHFGWMTSVRDKKTGKDLYPEFRQKELECHLLADWDELGLSRIMYRTYGLWPYPGTNHIGEYIAWSDEFLASSKIQYFYDPVKEQPWDTKIIPRFIYSFASNPTAIGFDSKNNTREDDYEKAFKDSMKTMEKSNEYGVPIIESVLFDLNTVIPSLNISNHGQMPELLDGMAVEGACLVNAEGYHLLTPETRLPSAVATMINTQGAIAQLLLEAFVEKSRGKLLQALLLDPTVSTYNNAVELVNEVCKRQKGILPEMFW